MKFGTAIVDPPWPYERTSASAKLSGYSDDHYEPLDADALRALPVGDLVEGVVLLWTTSPMLPLALELLSAWGFAYVTAMYWVKASGPLRQPESERQHVLFGEPESEPAFAFRPHYGVGYWVRGNVEPVLVAKTPGSQSYRTSTPAAFVTTRGGHSEKPDTLHRLAEANFPGPYLELFARRPREGWTTVGDGLDGRDIRQVLPELAA